MGFLFLLLKAKRAIQKVKTIIQLRCWIIVFFALSIVVSADAHLGPAPSPRSSYRLLSRTHANPRKALL